MSQTLVIIVVVLTISLTLLTVIDGRPPRTLTRPPPSFPHLFPFAPSGAQAQTPQHQQPYRTIFGAVSTAASSAASRLSRILESDVPTPKEPLPFVPNEFHKRKATSLSWCRDCIDIVIPYVNGSDPWYQHNLLYYKSKSKHLRDAVSVNRFADHNELLFLLRSIELYAPWIRLIHIVVNGAQVPNWLDTSNPKVRIVPHSLLFPAEDLPTFNIYAIKTHLYRIPDVAPRFIYCEDDQMFGNLVDPNFFYDPVTFTTKLFFEEAIAVQPERPAVSSPDNTEWMALRTAARLLLSKYPTKLHKTVYISHMPFLCHRELYRELMESEFREEAMKASATRFRGDNGIEVRVLIGYYQMLRDRKELSIDYVFNTLLDLNRDGKLDENELHGLAEFVGVPSSDLRTLLLNNNVGDITLQTVTKNPALHQLIRMGWEYLENTYSNPVVSDVDFMLVILRQGVNYLERTFDALKKRRPLIFCLNDNMDNPDKALRNDAEDGILRNMLDMFPNPSKFELPDHTALRFHREANRKHPNLPPVPAPSMKALPKLPGAKPAPPPAALLVKSQSDPTVKAYLYYKIGFKVDLGSYARPSNAILISALGKDAMLFLRSAQNNHTGLVTPATPRPLAGFSMVTPTPAPLPPAFSQSATASSTEVQSALSNLLGGSLPPTPVSDTLSSLPPTPVSDTPSSLPPTPVSDTPSSLPPTPVSDTPSSLPPTPVSDTPSSLLPAPQSPEFSNSARSQLLPPVDFSKPALPSESTGPPVSADKRPSLSIEVFFREFSESAKPQGDSLPPSVIMSPSDRTSSDSTRAPVAATDENRLGVTLRNLSRHVRELLYRFAQSTGQDPAARAATQPPNKQTAEVVPAEIHLVLKSVLRNRFRRAADKQQ